MRKIINYFIFFGILFCFSCCNKCHKKQLGYYDFSPQDLQINPYNGHEVLLFQNLSSDSLLFSAGSRESYMIETYNSQHDEYNCDYYVLEKNDMLITSNNNSWKFSILLSTCPSPSTSGFYKTITFGSVLKEQTIETNSQSTVIFERDTITSYNYYWPYDDLIFHKTLTLGPNSYTDVYEVDLIREDVNFDNWVDKIYYNIKKGIVGFSTHANELWYFDKHLN